MKRFVLFILFVCHVCTYAKPILIGIPEYAPPFVSSSSGGKYFYGFYVDLMNIICKQIRTPCEYRGMDIGELYSNLDNGNIDLILVPAPIASTSNGNHIFSLPYLESRAQFITTKAHSDIQAISDLKGKKVGVMKYTLYEALIEASYHNLFVLIEFTSVMDMANALTNEEIDAVILTDRVAKYVAYNTPAELKLVGDKIPLGNGYGIIALKKNAPLIKKINSALLKMEEDGSYLNIYNTYFSN